MGVFGKGNQANDGGIAGANAVPDEDAERIKKRIAKFGSGNDMNAMDDIV